MNRERLLQLLVVLDVLFVFASMGAEIFFGWTLPAPLREFTGSRTPGVLRLAILAVTSACALVAWVGLLNFRPFARRLYAVAWAGGTLLLLVSGPMVATPIGAAFTSLGALLGGLILGLVYFSDVARRFEPRHEAALAGAAARS